MLFRSLTFIAFDHVDDALDLLHLGEILADERRSMVRVVQPRAQRPHDDEREQHAPRELHEELGVGGEATRDEG